MSLINDLRKKAADLVSDEVPEANPVPVVGVGLHAGPVLQSLAHVDLSPAAVAPLSTTPQSDALYAALVGRTSAPAVSTPALDRLTSLAEPLRSVISDPALCLKAAFAQAAAQGLGSADLRHDLDVISKSLEQEKASFDSGLSAKRIELVDGHTAEANDLERQIVELQAKLNSIRSAVTAAEVRLNQRAADFTAAYKRRKTEIESTAAGYAAILK